MCNDIAPAQIVSAIQWTEITKYLKKQHDVHITVLTNEKDYSERPRGGKSCTEGRGP